MAKRKNTTKNKDVEKEETKPKPRAKSATPRFRKKLKEAQETQRFFLVVAIATLILAFLLFLIFARK